MIVNWLLYAPLWQLQVAIAAGVIGLLAWLWVKLRKHRPKVYRHRVR